MAELRKIQGSTLIESIVAMVIITVSFGVALLILSNISGKNNPQLKFKAYSEAQNTINNSIITSNFIDEDWQKEGLYIEKLILPYHEYEGLRVIEVKVFNNSGKLLIDRKDLIKIPE
jgi:competence protein ComGC